MHLAGIDADERKCTRSFQNLEAKVTSRLVHLVEIFGARLLKGKAIFSDERHMPGVDGEDLQPHELRAGGYIHIYIYILICFIYIYIYIYI